MILASLKTYWSGNGTLTAALPITKVYLDLVPEKTPFPYARLSMIGGQPAYMTGGTHIETFNYQLAIYHTDMEALATIADSIMGQLDQSYPTTGTLLHTRTSAPIITTEIENGVYTYGCVLQYQWTYNSLAD